MKLDVLDKGYVRLVDHMGDDISVVNAARVSYDRESSKLDERDIKLLSFLVRERHTAPFRHGVLTFEVYAPMFVARQWWKHIIGGTQSEYPESQQMWAGYDPLMAWNESSRRYVTENEEFHIPESDMWRSKPENNKQGSGANLSVAKGFNWTGELRDHIEQGVRQYQAAMEAGIAPEQARLFLSAYSLYIRWRWTTSLQGAMHFIELRDEAHAQWEIQEYARGIRVLTATKFPVSIGGMQ